MRTMFLEKIDTARQDLANSQRMHDTEVTHLRVQIDELGKQVDQFSWTDTQIAEAASLDSEQQFSQALTAETDSARRGLLGLLTGRQEVQKTEWFTSSAWPERICRHIEDVRGGRGSAFLVRLLTSNRSFTQHILSSPVFERFKEVLCLWRPHVSSLPSPATDSPAGLVTEFMTPADVIGLIETQHAKVRTRSTTAENDAQVSAALRFSRGQSEWSKIRLDMARALLQCLSHETVDAESDKSIAAFISTSAPLQLLAILTRQECSLGAPADSDTLAASAKIYSTVAQRISFVDGSLNALWNNSAVFALGELMKHESSVIDSTKALNSLSFDVASQEKLLVQGCLGPVMQCLRTWSQRIESSQGAEERRVQGKIKLLPPCAPILPLYQRGNPY